MKKLLFSILTVLGFCSGVFAADGSNRLVILHTNDTHSAIYPDAKRGTGGIMRRKVVIDSVRAENPNVLLVDAGDAVQGTLYFTIFKGDVERQMMNALGYDIAILGNHEFDNGLEMLANQYRQMNAELLSSNYDFSGTPLEGLFLPYSIREYNGRKIAFIAINIIPDGLIDDENIAGVKYNDGVKVANNLAHLLKEKEKADMVIAITHVGLTSEDDDDPVLDPKIAAGGSDIDIIIGGHSHTNIIPGSPESKLLNASGETVLVAQNGKSGLCIGEIDIDLDNLTVTNKQIAIDSRLDSRIDRETESQLSYYKHIVDSIGAIKIGKSAMDMPNSGNALLNLASDMVKTEATRLSGIPVDLAIMNKGGLRTNLYKGDVTKGQLMDIFPFDNRIMVVEMTGEQLHRLFDAIAARGGNGVSKGVEISMDAKGKKCHDIMIDGKPIDEKAIYRVASIDYLVKGGDKMTPFKESKVLYKSEKPLFEDLINHIVNLKGKKLSSTDEARMHY